MFVENTNTRILNKPIYVAVYVHSSVAVRIQTQIK